MGVIPDTPALRLRCAELADVTLRAGLRDFTKAVEAGTAADAPTRPDDFIRSRIASLLAELATGHATLAPNKEQVAKAVSLPTPTSGTQA